MCLERTSPALIGHIFSRVQRGPPFLTAIGSSTMQLHFPRASRGRPFITPHLSMKLHTPRPARPSFKIAEPQYPEGLERTSPALIGNNIPRAERGLPFSHCNWEFVNVITFPSRFARPALCYLDHSMGKPDKATTHPYNALKT